MRCRALENNKAEKEKKVFQGSCPFDVTEIAYPVLYDERLLCVVYVGLLAEDMNRVKKKIIHTASVLNSPPDSVLEAMDCLQPCTDTSRYRMLAQAISEYIFLLYSAQGMKTEADGYHEAVAAALEYIHAGYSKEIGIDNIAKRYGMNAKYIGRLFKQQTGESFCSYLNRVRISHAKRLLAETCAPVIEAAPESGYNNVTYFNRVFRQAEKMTPGEYRRLHSGL